MVTNFLNVRDHLFFGKEYVFIDTIDHHYQRIMKRSGIILWRVKEYIKQDSPYRLISCYVRKSDEETFLEALKQLRNYILLMGYNGYDELCLTLSELKV